MTKVNQTEPVKTFSKLYEDLTVYEQWFIGNNIGTGQPECPVCQKGKFLEGPSGGCSVNVKCDICGTKFNIAVFARNLVMGERIGDPDVEFASNN